MIPQAEKRKPATMKVKMHKETFSFEVQRARKTDKINVPIQVYYLELALPPTPTE